MLSAFQQQKKAVQASGQAYKQAEQKVGQLAREYQKTVKRTKAMQRLLNNARSAFEITGSTVKLFFNGFMVGVNGFGAVVTATFASITSGLSSLFKAVNADAMAHLFRRNRYFRMLIRMKIINIVSLFAYSQLILLNKCEH